MVQRALPFLVATEGEVMGESRRRQQIAPQNYGTPDIWEARILTADDTPIADIPYTVPRGRGAGPAVAVLIMSVLQEPDHPANRARLAASIGAEGAGAILSLVDELPQDFVVEVWHEGLRVGAAFSTHTAYEMSGDTVPLEAIAPARVTRAAGCSRKSLPRWRGTVAAMNLWEGDD